LVHRFGIWFGVAIGLGIAAARKNAAAIGKKIGQIVYTRLASTWLVHTALRTYIRTLFGDSASSTPCFPARADRPCRCAPSTRRSVP
jgi:hypothetical protein